MKTFMQNQKGFGLLETMVGFALLGAGAYIVLEGIDFIGDKKDVIDRSASQEAVVSGLVESIRANIHMEKVDFSADEFIGNTTYEKVHESLNLCWVNDGIVPAEVYPKCPGRIGYVVTPLKMGGLELRGLYKITLRMTHQELFPGTFKQYEFIVKDP
jgi:hypothetical protein